MILSAYDKHPVGASFKRWLSQHDVTAVLEQVPRPGGANAALWITPRTGFDHAMLLLHGMGNDHLYANVDLFSALVTNGIAVLSIDLDGHGRLSASILNADDLDALTQEAWVLLRRLAGDTSLHLVGYSLGAALSLQAAALLAPRTLTLISFPLARPSKWRFLASEARTFLHPSFFRAARRHGFDAVWPAFGGFGRARYPVRLATVKDEWAYVEEVERYMARIEPLALAATLAMPTLWLGGGRDRLCPSHELEKAARESKLGTARTLPGAGHLTALFHDELGRTIVHHLRRER